MILHRLIFLGRVFGDPKLRAGLVSLFGQRPGIRFGLVITLENGDIFCLVGVACVVVMGNQPTISLFTVLQRVFYGVGFSVLLVFRLRLFRCKTFSTVKCLQMQMIYRKIFVFSNILRCLVQRKKPKNKTTTNLTIFSGHHKPNKAQPSPPPAITNHHQPNKNQPPATTNHHKPAKSHHKFNKKNHQTHHQPPQTHKNTINPQIITTYNHNKTHSTARSAAVRSTMAAVSRSAMAASSRSAMAAASRSAMAVSIGVQIRCERDEMRGGLRERFLRGEVVRER